ncbi:hypothetical protein ANANG_G00052980, partial [Anguilla anguilla]
SSRELKVCVHLELHFEQEDLRQIVLVKNVVGALSSSYLQLVVQLLLFPVYFVPHSERPLCVHLCTFCAESHGMVSCAGNYRQQIGVT